METKRFVGFLLCRRECTIAVAFLLVGSTFLGCVDGAPSNQRGSAEAALQARQSSARTAGTGDTSEAVEGAITSAPEEVASANETTVSSSLDSVKGASPLTENIPEGMVYVPGGKTRIGITEETWRQVQQEQKTGMRAPWGQAARTSFEAEVNPFFLEKHPVTVAQFRQFSEATGFESQAERFGNAGVMRQGRWQLVSGATWAQPRGPSSGEASEHHPVTQVSWNDAEAYCQWKDRRLPTEVEWEHAARGATNNRALCPDGVCPRLEGERRETTQANIWQGRFPTRNTVADGYRYTAPVGTFGETELGLTDMSGNVWEWTSSWYRPYSERGVPFRLTKQSEKVQRGGSFQCNECGGYRVFARSHATPETSLFHVGFRCARDTTSPQS